MTRTIDARSDRPDTRDMVLVHRTFRRCLRDLPGIPRNRLLFQLGLLMDGLPPADAAVFWGELPLPARVAWRVVGRRRYLREIDHVYGR